MKEEEHRDQERATMIMKRAAARFRQMDLCQNFAEWQTNYRADVLGMWKTRHSKLQEEHDALTLKHTFMTQSNAEKVMRNVVHRLQQREKATAFISIRQGLLECKAQAKAED